MSGIEKLKDIDFSDLASPSFIVSKWLTKSLVELKERNFRSSGSFCIPSDELYAILKNIEAINPIALHCIRVSEWQGSVDLHVTEKASALEKRQIFATQFIRECDEDFKSDSENDSVGMDSENENED
jgi:hypothetical protein